MCSYGAAAKTTGSNHTVCRRFAKATQVRTNLSASAVTSHGPVARHAAGLSVSHGTIIVSCSRTRKPYPWVAPFSKQVVPIDLPTNVIVGMGHGHA